VEVENRVHDYQEIKVQESMQAPGVGTVPRSIVVVLDDDLVDTIQAGGEMLAPLSKVALRKLISLL
jgi:DNA replicative helicase MCM subunit Mcm2 (Cdc46/Mcm family)